MHATDDGESTLMVGADDEAAFKKVEPIIRTMAGYVFFMVCMSSLGHIPSFHHELY